MTSPLASELEASHDLSTKLVLDFSQPIAVHPLRVLFITCRRFGVRSSVGVLDVLVSSRQIGQIATVVASKPRLPE